MLKPAVYSSEQTVYILYQIRVVEKLYKSIIACEVLKNSIMEQEEEGEVALQYIQPLQQPLFEAPECGYFQFSIELRHHCKTQ
jgi:hypothetical protein